MVKSLLGTVTLAAEFKDFEKAPEGTKYVVWAKSPDNEFIPLGEFTDPPSKIKFTRELNVDQMGLFITLEESKKMINFDSRSQQPSNQMVGIALKPEE